MASTALSDLLYIDPSQNGKAASHNAAVAALDMELNATLTIQADMLANPYQIPYTVADEPAGVKTALRFIFANVIGALTTSWTAFMPAGKQKLFIVQNSTTGGHSVTFMVQGQTGVTVPPGEAFLCLLDGVDVVQPPLNMLAGSNPWEVGNFLTGSPTIGQVVMRFIPARTVTFPADFSSNQMKSNAGAGASATWNFNVNGVLAGTAVFSIGATTPTWSSIGHAPVVMNAGDVGTFTAPNPVDAGLADLEWTFSGTR